MSDPSNDKAAMFRGNKVVSNVEQPTVNPTTNQNQIKVCIC